MNGKQSVMDREREGGLLDIRLKKLIDNHLGSRCHWNKHERYRDTPDESGVALTGGAGVNVQPSVIYGPDMGPQNGGNAS